MEFTKDIKFNDSLSVDKQAEITYSGELFKNGSQYVNLVYGFGENWANTTSQPMTKQENGFTANVKILDFDTFNFCFSNENNVWDNNNSFNYISPILPAVITEGKAEISENLESDINFGEDYASTIDGIIEDILGNTVQNSIAIDNEESNVDKILDSITKETLPEIEELFNELFCAEFEEKAPVQEIKEEIVEKVQPATNEELIELFNQLFSDANTPVYFEDLVEEKQEEYVAPDFSELFETVTISQPEINKEPVNLNVASFNLDGLVSDILESVINQDSISNIKEEVSLFDDLKEHEDDIYEEKSLAVIDGKEFLISSRRLGFFYKAKKKLKLGFYKLFVKAPKALAKQLGFDRNY